MIKNEAVTPEQVVAVRARLGQSVEDFGARFGRSGRTVEDWEQGRRVPDVMVRREIRRIERRLKIPVDTDTAKP